MNNSKSIELELRGFLNEDFDGFIYHLHRVIKNGLIKNVNKLEAWRSSTIFPKSKLDLRIKIKGEKIKAVYKRRNYKQSQNDIDEKIEIESILKNQSDIKTIINIYRIFDVDKVTLLNAYNLAIRIDDNYVLSIKKDSYSGKFWELDTNVLLKEVDTKSKKEKEKTLKKYRNKLDLIAKNLELKSEDPNHFKETQKNKVPAEAHYKVQGNFNEVQKLIVKLIEEHRLIDFLDELKYLPIRDRLKFFDNDYSFIEWWFKFLFGKSFLNPSFLKNFDSGLYRIIIRLLEHITFSVIVIHRNDFERIKYNLLSIKMQKGIDWKQGEIIIVDDGSDPDVYSRLTKFVNDQCKGFNIKLIRQTKNNGRSIARNLGAQVSTGNVLIFLDGDIVLPKDYIWIHLLLHALHGKIITMSLKENVNLNDLRLEKLGEGKAFSSWLINDFRSLKKIYIRDEYSVSDKKQNLVITNKEWIRTILQTDNFKKLGKGLQVGVWDLPKLVVSHNLVVSKSEFEKVVGFDIRFKGWGFEDTYLGAKLISYGNYVIPLSIVPVLHINHTERSESKKKKYLEAEEDAKLYSKLLNQVL